MPANLDIDAFNLMRVSQLVYPVIITQMAGEISESKASELLGMTIEGYRCQKEQITSAFLKLLAELPSPLILLLEGIQARRKSKEKCRSSSRLHGKVNTTASGSRKTT